MNASNVSPSPQPTAFLQLPRYYSKIPCKYLSVGSYLLGSAADCRVRLGDDSVPSRHSQLLLTETSAQIETLSSRYRVIVNGQAVTSCLLRNGDLLEIGAVRMVFRKCAPETPAEVDHPLDNGIGVDDDATEKSARELVAAIERSLAVIDQYEESTEERVSKLLVAAANRIDGSGCQLGIAAGTAGVARSESQAAQLPGIHDQLGNLRQVVEDLLYQQRLMAETIQTMSLRLGEVHSVIAQPPRRASA
jgi:hypothetical protein